MKTSAQPLLDAIAAAPEDDAVRLVYADWLLESGNRLGELIVAQLSQAEQPADPELDRRVAALISAHQSEVIGDLPVSKPVFRRGFVEAAEITALDFINVGAQLFERLPLLAELVIWSIRVHCTFALASSVGFHCCTSSLASAAPMHATTPVISANTISANIDARGVLPLVHGPAPG